MLIPRWWAGTACGWSNRSCIWSNRWLAGNRRHRGKSECVKTRFVSEFLQIVKMIRTEQNIPVGGWNPPESGFRQPDRCLTALGRRSQTHKAPVLKPVMSSVSASSHLQRICIVWEPKGRAARQRVCLLRGPRPFRPGGTAAGTRTTPPSSPPHTCRWGDPS